MVCVVVLWEPKTLETCMESTMEATSMHADQVDKDSLQTHSNQSSCRCKRACTVHVILYQTLAHVALSSTEETSCTRGLPTANTAVCRPSSFYFNYTGQDILVHNALHSLSWAIEILSGLKWRHICKGRRQLPVPVKALGNGWPCLKTQSKLIMRCCYFKAIPSSIGISYSELWYGIET